MAGTEMKLPEWALGPFTRPEDAQPLITPRPESRFRCPMHGIEVAWEALHTFNPAAVVREGKVHVLYRAEDDTGQRAIGGHTSRVGLAVSDDGLAFERLPEPVLFPAEDEQAPFEWYGGCEDPRVTEREDGLFVMTYTAYNRDSRDFPIMARLSIARSRDLVHWEKAGPAFQRAYEGRFLHHWGKSGSLVCKLDGEHLVAAKLDGKYWMYWGESPVWAATSDDLLDWEPVLNLAGELAPVFAPREGKFDSLLVEPGPPALLTEAGIVFLYNGKNAEGVLGDESLGTHAYAGGQALLDPENPMRLIARLEEPFFRPELPWERTGQYVAGTTFLEGLVRHQGKWLLYYGCADSFVGVAIAEDKTG